MCSLTKIEKFGVILNFLKSPKFAPRIKHFTNVRASQFEIARIADMGAVQAQRNLRERARARAHKKQINVLVD